MGELGQEDDPETYVAHLVAVFAAVGRVMRDDATLWVNLAGNYWSHPGGQNGSSGTVSAKAVEANRQQGQHTKKLHPVYKDLDWVDVPGLFARAMQAAGWYWRSDVVWIKPSPLPESVSGTRWERCRRKVAMNKHRDPKGRGGQQRMLENPEDHRGINPDWLATYEDCPGCPKCAPDGYVLRRGNGRPTKSTEQILLFAKKPGYYYDTEAVREPNTEGSIARFANDPHRTENKKYAGTAGISPAGMNATEWRGNGRNMRDAWTMGPEPLKDEHYAAYPSALPTRCIKAGTSERGCCPHCGAPHARIVSREKVGEREKRHERYGPLTGTGDHGTTGFDGNGMRYDADYALQTTTLGWRPTCACPSHEPRPCVVLDPFGGSGSTGLAADRLGRDAVLVELKPEYAALAERRLVRDAPLLMWGAVTVEGDLGAEAAG